MSYWPWIGRDIRLDFDSVAFIGRVSANSRGHIVAVYIASDVIRSHVGLFT